MLWQELAAATVLDLGQPMRNGMPQSASHAPFRMQLEQRHGDSIREDGGSMSNEIIITGGHTGTHVDALSHVSAGGLLHGGVSPASVQSASGFSELGIDTLRPFVGRGVLLDVAAVHGLEFLPAGYEVTVDDLETARRRAGVHIDPGDAILVGTGWSRRWHDYSDFAGAVHGAPGPGADAAYWLAALSPSMVGGETIAFEHIPAGKGHARLPAHTILLVEQGIHIIETMRLVDLLEAGVHEFALVVSPLPLVGATGAPVRPLALLDPVHPAQA